MYIAWLQALVAMLGSLYFSEILRLPPCNLCWYQRILMYPLVVILAVGIIRKDKAVPYYVLPFSALGIVISFYQYMLQAGVISESQAPCSVNIPCTTQYLEFFGFVTIPFLSLLAFLVITLCMIVFTRYNYSHEPRK